MVKSAENRMRSNLELLPVINVKSHPRYISAQKVISPTVGGIFLRFDVTSLTPYIGSSFFGFHWNSQYF
jgi:hypothetical protein